MLLVAMSNEPLTTLAAPMSSGLAQARARRALRSLGVSDAVPLTRANSVTNEVWFTDDYVVRVNRHADLRLRREAVLAQDLPAEIGYPPVIQYGGELGADWLVVQRLPGQPLSRCWPAMGHHERRAAVRQLADRLRIVHATPCPPLDGLVDTPQLLDPAPTGQRAVHRLLGAVADAGRLPWVDPGIMGDIAAMVQADAGALEPFDATTMVHGDVTFENVLWDRDHISSLLDFEFARPGPPDLDLDVLLRFAAYPFLHVPPAYENETRAADYERVPWWLLEDYPELFTVARQFERIRLYSIAWDIKEVLSFPPQVSLHHVHSCHPYQRLVHVLRGTSYLDRLNGGLQIDW
jgi:scyllo-inosamine 4-kinase